MRSGSKSAVILQARDHALSDALKLFRFLTVEQVCRLGAFRTQSRARARLAQLCAAGVVVRFYVGTIKGGRRAVFALPGELRSRYRSSDLASLDRERFIIHYLAVNDICLGAIGDAAVAARVERIDRPIPTDSGVLPDGFIVTDMPRKLGVFLEVDLGTESMTVWRQKAAKYLQLARSSYCSARFGPLSFRVAVVAEPEDRIEAIRRVISSETNSVFWLANTTTIKREGFWGAVWRRPLGDQLLSLQ